MSVTDDALGDYLAAREKARLEDVADALHGMNPRERRLVQEAAVMGYVRGMMAAQAGQEKPDDSPKVVEVIDACLSMPDLYPVMSRVQRAGRKRREASS